MAGFNLINEYMINNEYLTHHKEIMYGQKAGFKIGPYEFGKFMYKDFVKWIKASIGDQALLKILNELEGYGLLRSVQSKNNKLFYVNEEMTAYSLGKHKR